MARFAFESKCWSKVIHKTIMLKQVFRQKDSGTNNIYIHIYTLLYILYINNCFAVLFSFSIPHFLEFVDILNEMRLGRLSEAAIQKFRSLSRTPQTYNMIEPTEL